MEQNSFCIKNCEYLITKGMLFQCNYYEKILETGLSLSKSSIRPIKCVECSDENIITTEKAKEIMLNSIETIEGHIEYLRELLEVL